MKYRKFGELDWEVSVLGFGAMRLPHEEDDYGAIEEDKAAEMLHHAIDEGVNYIDTAWPYHRGESESFLGRALEGGYREKVRLTTKMPSWKIEKKDDFDIFLDAQMEKLQTGYIDFYLLHALQRDWWDKLKGLGALEWAERKMADGVIGYLGFSFHDRFPLFKRIIDEYDNWSLVMMMYNYMETGYQAGREGFEYAADRGLAMVVMEPLRGGLLAKEPPLAVRTLFDNAPVRRTPADWSLQWLWNHDRISTIVSGMSSMDQVTQNIASACVSEVGLLEPEELDLIEKVREEYLRRTKVPCTDCRYCLPCPQGVAIPQVFEYYNMTGIYDDVKMARENYAFLGDSSHAGLCNECGKCMELCPQHINIIELLKSSHAMLASEKS